MSLSYRIFQSHFMMTNCVCASGGDGVVVIDPGVFEDEVATVGAYASSFGRVDLAYTHFDFDHIIDPPLQAEARAVRWASSESAGRARSEIMSSWARYDAQFYIERSRPRVVPSPDQLMVEPVSTMGTSIGDVVAVKVPGHTADSMAYVVPAIGLAVVGDMMSDVEPPSIEMGASCYSQSLLDLRAVLMHYGVSVVVPGHGRVAPSRDAWLARVGADMDYVEKLAICARGLDRDASSEGLEEAARTVNFMGQVIAPWHHEWHLSNLRREVLRDW